MTDIEQERELLANLSRALEDETMPTAERSMRIDIARDELRAFYRRIGMLGDPAYYRFDDESKSLVPFEPASVKQDAWSYRG